MYTVTCTTARCKVARFINICVGESNKGKWPRWELSDDWRTSSIQRGSGWGMPTCECGKAVASAPDGGDHWLIFQDKRKKGRHLFWHQRQHFPNPPLDRTRKIFNWQLTSSIAESAIVHLLKNNTHNNIQHKLTNTKYIYLCNEISMVISHATMHLVP